MSNDKSSTSGHGQPQSQLPMLNQLLTIATEVQGDRPADPNITSRTSEEDRAWLANALEQISADTDPVKKLKRWMERMNAIEDPNQENLADINDILEEIGDLVCDIDLAQVFCALNGLDCIQKFLDKKFDPASALFVHLIGVLAQYNQKVQQLLLKGPFLEHCLDVISDDTKITDYRHKCVAAISSMVKGYVPALIRFIQQDGPNKLMHCFDMALAQPDSLKLVHRCAVAAISIKNSFSYEVVNIDPTFRKISQGPEEMKVKILEKNAADKDEGKYNDTLEFLS